MMKRLGFYFISLFLLVFLPVSAQEFRVSGTVVDASDGSVIPFASIQLKGTMTGASTDIDGNYSIDIPQDAILIFSSIGYKNLEVAVAGRTRVDVSLEQDSEMLDETIVVAFGTSTKEAFTGSATVVKSSDIAKVQATDATRALEGMVAGVQMTTATGSLGSSPSIRIRGTSSITAGSSPLYIVDGVPYSGDMNNLNPNDIETMTVLKDAASNALYGARGANGVIMITTKKAKTSDAVVNIDAKWGLNTKALRTYDYITDPAMYYETHYAALYNYYVDGGMSPMAANKKASETVAGPASDGGLGYQVFTVPEGQAFIGSNGRVNPRATLGRLVTHKGQTYLLQPDNWMDEAYRQSFRQEYNVSVSGTIAGKASIFASFGYHNNKGIINGEDMYRYTARIKADYQAKKWLKIGVNAAYTRFHLNNGNSDEGGGSTGNIFSFASGMAPIYPVYIRDASGNILKDEHGMKRYDYGSGDNAGLQRPNNANSNALHSVILDKNISEGNALNATGFVEIKFLKDFTFTFNAGVGVDETRITNMMNNLYGQFAPSGGAITKSHARSLYFNMQQLLSWDRAFGVHHVSALIGHESYQDDGYSLSASKSKIFSLDNMELDGAVINGQSSSGIRPYNNEGYLARVQYDFSNKIFLSASYRLDASSRFHPDHRWGSFWSVGAGWLINEEKWFNADWVDMLKIKASIGSQGNDNIGDFLYTDLYNIINNEGDIAIQFVSKGNPEITWETNTNFNTGLDFSFFRDRLSGSLEYFYRKTSDMLFFFSVPTSLGYSGYYDNIGDMRNSGVEMSLNAGLIRNRKLNWDFYLNFTHYRNKVTMLPEDHKTVTIDGCGGYVSGNKFVGEGLPLYTFYLPVYEGVDKETGLPMWRADVLDDNENVIGTTTTTNYDEAGNYLCGNPTPALYGGFGTSLSFFGFDLAASFTYSIGGRTYDSGYASLMGPPGATIGQNYHKDVLKAWSVQNPDTDIPRWQYHDQNINASSSRFLVNASYLNFQNLQFGYSVPEKAVKKLRLSSLRFYISCDNVVYWSARRGLDPRQSFTGSTSNLMNSPVRTVSGGISLSF